MDNTLIGCKVLYTRSVKHWATFAQKILSFGGQPYHLPLMETRPQKVSVAEKIFCQHADSFIFTSTEAVVHFSKSLLPINAEVIAIGKATRSKLLENNYEISLTAPPPYSSESLLRIYKPSARQIAIIAAPYGRRYLYQSLNKENNAALIYVYERYNPSPYWLEFLPIPDALVLSSVQTLKFLLQITPQTTLNLLQCHAKVIALSKRIAQAAHHAGFLSVCNSEKATETAQIQTLCRWWSLKQGVSI